MHIVLVHGAWHDPWCWSAVSRLLEPEHVVSAVGLHRGTLGADTTAVQETIDAMGAPAIVCGHSYGGAVITGLKPDLIKHAVYLAAMIPDAHEAIASVTEPGGLSYAEYTGDGARCLVRPDAAREVFYGDCPDDVVAAATSRLVAQETAVFLDPPGRALWRDVPATYVVCTQDKAVPVAYQEAALCRVSRFEVWPCSHSPFLSQPARVAGLLARLAAQQR